MNDFDKIKRIFEKSVPVEHGRDMGQIIIDGWITLTSVEVQEKVRKIAGTLTYKSIKWNIEKQVIIHGVRYRKDGSGEPDEIDFEEVESGLSLIQACKSVWHMIKDNEVDGMFENFSYEEEALEEYVNDKMEGI